MEGNRSMPIQHPMPPLCGDAPRVLILGSFPSVRSREAGFFYGHPRNRFWQVMAAVLRAPIPDTVEEKSHLLISHGIALWDVVASCSVRGSADHCITDVTPNDLTPILSRGTVTRVFTNGKTAARLYDRHVGPTVTLPMTCLPSTSPANAACSLDDLIRAWSVVGDAVQKIHRTE